MPDANETRPSRRARGGPGILTNSVINVGAQVSVAGLGAIGGLITAHVLGPAGVGILAVAFILADFGRAISGCTHVPSILEYHRGASDDRVFGTSLLVKVTAAILFGVVLLALSPWLSGLFEIPALALLLASTVIVASTFYEVGAARLEADNRFLRNALILGSGSVVGVAAVVALWLTDNLTVYTSILTTLLANVTMSAVAARFAFDPRHVRFDGKLARKMVSYGLQIVLVQLLAQALLQTDTLMVSALLGNDDAGVYNIVFQLTFLIVTASTAMGTALVPALSELVGRGEDTAEGYHRGTLIALAFSVSLAVVYALGGRLILGLYGPAFAQGYPALLFLSIFGIAAALAVPASSMLTVHGRAHLLVGLSLAQLALNVLLNYFFITWYGTTGAAIATMIVFVMGTIASWIAVHRLTGARPLSRRVLAEAATRAMGWLRR